MNEYIFLCFYWIKQKEKELHYMYLDLNVKIFNEVVKNFIMLFSGLIDT